MFQVTPRKSDVVKMSGHLAVAGPVTVRVNEVIINITITPEIRVHSE